MILHECWTFFAVKLTLGSMRLRSSVGFATKLGGSIGLGIFPCASHSAVLRRLSGAHLVLLYRTFGYSSSAAFMTALWLRGFFVPYVLRIPLCCGVC
jgi:hypothetical protein